jgi:hypothetical protein
MSDVRLDFQPNKPHSTKGTLIVLAGNDTRALHSDTLDVANDKRRTAFIEKLTREHQGICPDKVQQAILGSVGKLIKCLNSSRCHRERIDERNCYVTTSAYG